MNAPHPAPTFNQSLRNALVSRLANAAANASSAPTPRARQAWLDKADRITRDIDALDARNDAIKAAALRTDVLRNELCEVLSSERSDAVKLAMAKSITASLTEATRELTVLMTARG